MRHILALLAFFTISIDCFSQIKVTSVGGLGLDNGFVICGGMFQMKLNNVKDDSDSSARSVKLKAVLVSYLNGSPLNDFRIYKAIRADGQNTIAIVDTIYIAHDNFRSGRQGNNWKEGSFVVNTKLKKDERLYIEQTGYSMLELSFD